MRPGSHRQIFESWHRSGDVSDNRLPDLPWNDAVPVEGQAGDVLFVPDGAVHAAKNVGSDEAAELGTYIVEKGKPLTEIIK